MPSQRQPGTGTTEPIGPQLWIADGGTVPFFGFDYPTPTPAAHGEIARGDGAATLRRAFAWLL